MLLCWIMDQRLMSQSAVCMKVGNGLWISQHSQHMRAANNIAGDLYVAYPSVRVSIGDEQEDFRFFVQDSYSYAIILGQPFITEARMEIKVMDDGSAYGQVRSKDGMRALQFMTVCVNHPRNRDSLRDSPLPTKESNFHQVPLSYETTVIRGGKSSRLLAAMLFFQDFLDFQLIILFAFIKLQVYLGLPGSTYIRKRSN